MFGNKKEELVKEVRDEIRAEMESIKKEYISQITCCEDIVKAAQEIIRKAEEGIVRAEANSDELKVEFDRIMAVVSAKDANAKVFSDQQKQIETLTVQIAKLQEDLKASEKKIAELEAMSKGRGYIPPAESEYAALHYA